MLPKCKSRYGSRRRMAGKWIMTYSSSLFSFWESSALATYRPFADFNSFRFFLLPRFTGADSGLTLTLSLSFLVSASIPSLLRPRASCTRDSPRLYSPDSGRLFMADRLCDRLCVTGSVSKFCISDSFWPLFEIPDFGLRQAAVWLGCAYLPCMSLCACAFECFRAMMEHSTDFFIILWSAVYSC